MMLRWQAESAHPIAAFLMMLALVTVIAALCTVPALAEDAPVAPPPPASLLEAITGGKPLTNFRLRYEHVDQDGKTENANAWTLRSLIGWQTIPFHDFSVTAQLINVAVFNDDYDSFDKALPEPGKSNYPRVVDPDNTDINQLFVEYSGIPDTKVRLGRQSVKLDNVRFIGNVEFRQVMQVYDGIALENRSLPNTEIYLAHYDRIKQVTTKLQSGNVEIANIKYKFNPTENIVGYGYFLDLPRNGQNTGAAFTGTGFSDNSNRTLGLRLDGGHKINNQWKILYTAEYAKQNDYRSGNTLIDAHYYRVGAGAGYGDWSVRLDRELLSSNDGKYGFQTPLGTNHLFQGWADAFLTTPKQGIKDTFLSFGGKVFDVQLLGEYHWIDSDEGYARFGGGIGDKYGKEFDLSIAYPFTKQINAKLEYASFTEDERIAAAAARKPDLEKLWLTVMYTF